MFYNRFVFLKSTVRLSGSTTMSFPFSHLLLNINMLHAAASCKFEASQKNAACRL